MTNTFSPSRSGQLRSGIALTSVQYATSPMRKPKTLKRPWMSGIGVNRSPSTSNGVVRRCGGIRACGSIPAGRSSPPGWKA